MPGEREESGRRRSGALGESSGGERDDELLTGELSMVAMLGSEEARGLDEGLVIRVDMELVVDTTMDKGWEEVALVEELLL